MGAASQDFNATDTPRALEDELDLFLGLDGSAALHRMTNAGETVALWRIADAQPAADARGHPLGPFETVTVRSALGPGTNPDFRTWVWSLHPDGAALVVTETAE